MEMILWSLLHEVNTLGWGYNYPSLYIGCTRTTICNLGGIA